MKKYLVTFFLQIRNEKINKYFKNYFRVSFSSKYVV